MHCLSLADSNRYTLLCDSPDTSVRWRGYDDRPLETAKCQTSSGQHPPSMGAGGGGTLQYCHVETPTYTFTLPDLSCFPDDFRSYLERDLIETSSLKSLENSGHLNWWALESSCQKLWPLATKGDGNCLLHAASLGMWGFHDRFLILRKALHLLLTRGSRRHALWRRWRWQQTKENRQCGLELNEAEWAREWEFLVSIASPTPRSKKGDDKETSDGVDLTSRNGIRKESRDRCDVYESLDQLHVFALAHVLKRPIVIISDTVLRDSSGEAFSPIPFGGIYLPLECSPSECHRSPLVLCFDTAHFSALVAMQSKEGDRKTPALIPITYRDRSLLPLHFCSDPGPDFTWWKDEADEKIASQVEQDDTVKLSLICRYMEIVEVAVDKPIAKAATVGAPVHSCVSGMGADGSDSSSKRKHWSRSVGNLLLESYIHGSKETLMKLRARLKRRGTPELVCTYFGSSDPDASSTLGPLSRASRTLDGCGRPVVSLQDMRGQDWIFGAKIETHAHHQLMEEMINNYLTTAKQRFEEERNGKPTVRRERFSADLSNAKFTFSCINGSCNRLASQETNFLCRECFEIQTQILESFTANSDAVAAMRMQLQKRSDLGSRVVPALPLAKKSADTCSVANSKFYVNLPPSSSSSSSQAGGVNWACDVDGTVSSSSVTVVRFDTPPCDGDVPVDKEKCLNTTVKLSAPPTSLKTSYVRSLAEKGQRHLLGQARRSSIELKYEVTRHVDSAGFTRYSVSEVAETVGCSNFMCSRYADGHTDTCGLCSISRM